MGVTVLEAIRFWLLLVVLAVLNGALREKGLIPVLGPTRGLVISGILLSFLIVSRSLASGPAVRCSQCVAVLVHRPTLAGHDRLVRVWVRSLDCGKAVE